MVDMDGDGDFDMFWVFLSYNGQFIGYVGWVLNNGSSWGGYIFFWEEVEGVFDVFFMDLNGDGFIDIVVCKGDYLVIDYWINLGGGDFYNFYILIMNIIMVFYVQAVDLNEDGLMDIIVFVDNSFGGEDWIVWWLGIGGGYLGVQ